MGKIFKAFLIVLILISVSASCASYAQEAVPGDVIVVLKNSTPLTFGAMSQSSEGGLKSLSAVQSFAEAHDVRVTRTYDSLSRSSNNIFMLVHSDTKNENELLKELQKHPDVLAASLNRIVHLDLPEVPDDPDYNQLWGLDAIKAPQVWNISKGSEDVYVIVVDSGVDYNHPDLKANFSHEYSRSFLSSDKKGYNPQAYHDERGHGTHVSGTIAAVGNNSLGVVGVNWKAKIISVRVLDANGSGTAGDIIAAFNYISNLLDENPNVNFAAANFSISGTESITPEQEASLPDPLWYAFKTLSDKNRIIISCSAGNSELENGTPARSSRYTSSGSIEYLKGAYQIPPSFLGIDSMINVAAAENGLSRAFFSNYSRKYVDIAAPGHIILSCVPVNYKRSEAYANLHTTYPYQKLSGTSMAAPHVSGAAALLKSVYPDATASEIKAAIVGGADSNYLRDDGTSAYGFLDLTGAFAFMAGMYSKDIPPVIHDPKPDTGVIGQRYKFEFYAYGSIPMNWTIDGELPEGLIFESGEISGTPTEAGQFPIIVTAQNDYGYDSSVLTLSIDAPAVPVIRADTLSFDAYAGQLYDFSIEVMLEDEDSWPFLWSIDSSDIPSDFYLAIKPSTGALALRAAKAGTYRFNITASNDSGIDTQEFTLRVHDSKAPVIADTGILYEGMLGRVYAASLSSSSSGTTSTDMFKADGTLPISWDIKGLPEGLQFRTANRRNELSSSRVRIYGTPSVSGDFTITVTASNKYGTASRDEVLRIRDEKPEILVSESTSAEIYRGREFAKVIAVSGSAPIEFTLSGDLPDGTSIKSEDNTVIFYGRPEETGSFKFTLSARNANGSDEAAIEGYIKQRTETASSSYNLPEAVKGVPYEFKIKLLDDVPMNWAISYADSSLGLTVSQSGDLKALPSKTGVFAIIVAISSDDTKVESSFALYNLKVNELPSVKTINLPDGKINTPYSTVTLSADGSLPVYWYVSEGSLPDGLSLASNGYIFGTPSKSGPFIFTLKALNQFGYDTRTFTVNIASNVPGKKDDGKTNPPSGDDDSKKGGEGTIPVKKAHEGSARTVSALTSQERLIVTANHGVIAKVLPEISVDVSAFYTYQDIVSFADVKLSEDVPTGYALRWHPFIRTASGTIQESIVSVDGSASDYAFYDSKLDITDTVPDDRIINIGAYLEAGLTYAPVISAVYSSDVPGVGSAGSGCDSGMFVFAVFVPLIGVLIRKR